MDIETAREYCLAKKSRNGMSSVRRVFTCDESDG